MLFSLNNSRTLLQWRRHQHKSSVVVSDTRYNHIFITGQYQKHLTSLYPEMYYVPTHPNIVSYALYPYYLPWGSTTLYSFCKKKVAFVWRIYDDMVQKQSDIFWAAGTLRLTSGASICTAKPTNQVCISAFQVLPSSLHNHPVAFVASFSIHEMFAGEMLF